MSERFPGASAEQEPTPSQQIADVLRGFGETWGFDQQTCDELSGLPLGEALQDAYSMVTSADIPGVDPDEVFAPWMTPKDPE